MPNRTPDNVDEAGATIKHSLARLENRYQLAVAERVRRDKEAASPHLVYETIPDIYEPLKSFSTFLLPHLQFLKVDVSDEENVKCLWIRTDRQGSIVLDLDQLSSGEKALITLFLPLLETEIGDLLNAIDPSAAVAAKDTLMIIDEPEQHIHPDLQARVMTYIRRIAGPRRIQFIVSTHSPTILDQAWDDELYVLTPRGDDVRINQLQKVASNLERLEALRQLTGGNTFVVTTGRSIVCIEGHGADGADPSDIRLLEMMFPRATAYTFVPVGNKANVITTVRQLRERLPESTFKIQVYGITDRDRGATVPGVGVQTWPVCMIENFLLNVDVLTHTCEDLGIADTWQKPAIEAALAEIAENQRQDEVGLRVTRTLGAQTIRLKGASAEAVNESLTSQLEPFEELKANPERIEAALHDAAATVDEILRSGRALDEFRGKPMLRALYNKMYPGGAKSYAAFVQAISTRAQNHNDIQVSLTAFFDKLEAVPDNERRPGIETAANPTSATAI